MHTIPLFARGATRVKSWLKSWFGKPPPNSFLAPKSAATHSAPKSKMYVVNTPVAAEIVTSDNRPTKAYADQRQKAVHNRHRKPTKALRNLYKMA